MKLMPQEIEVWYVIPALRRDIAKHMLNAGLKQKEIAAKLGLTEPAVSQYIKSKRGKDIIFQKNIQDMIKKAAKKIIKNDLVMMTEMQSIIKIIRKTGLLCSIACKYHNVDTNCRACMR